MVGSAIRICKGQNIWDPSRGQCVDDPTCEQNKYFYILITAHKQNFGQGDIFTGVCLSTGEGRGSASRGSLPLGALPLESLHPGASLHPGGLPPEDSLHPRGLHLGVCFQVGLPPGGSASKGGVA